MDIVVKRVYDKPSGDDGYRVLVDRLWPRGVKKEVATLDEWCKAVAPSTELRRWFGHDPARFEEFAMQYQSELATSAEPQKLLDRAKDNDRLTLLYGAKDPKVNHAVVLKQFLESL